MINNNNSNLTCQYDNDSYNEGMTFLHDESNYYQNEELEDEIQHRQQTKSYQQGDDFRPTFYNPFEIKHRRRTSRAQFKVLEKTFLENPKPNAAIRRWLAQKLVMTPRGVQVWFQNRRAKEKTVNSKKPASTSTISKQDIIANSTSTESTLSLSPVHNSMNDLMLLSSEPLVKQPSNTSSYDELFVSHSPLNSSSMISSLSSSPSACAYNDCHSTGNMFIPTPMTRTMSYPPFYHSDASNADEEELLMTPVTPFVDTQLQQQQQLYDYPIFMNNNNKKFYQQQQQQQQNDWVHPQQQQQQQQQWPMSFLDQQQNMMRRMYHDNNMFEEQRRYSTTTTIEQDKFFQSNEVFRRLSEPIFDHPQQQQDMNQFNYNFNTQFDLLPRSNTRYSM